MGEMTAGRFPLFSLMFCFLLCSSEALEKIITADVGQDVILPCKVSKNYNINIRAVEWIRPDQDPDYYVLLYRDGRIDPDNQHESYQNRVDLQDKEMKDGNVSLILKNVKMEDTGKYECRVFEKGKNEPISNTILEVRVQTNITAEVGQNVTLPCKVPNNIHITSVIWRRPDLHPEYVLLYRSGRIDPDNQNSSYQNRVNLQDKDMKDGDFSLILKNVKMNDTGKYECLVFEKGKNYPIIRITILEVLPSAQKMTGVEKITADVGQNVTLPCKDPKNNKTITAVEWIRPDLEPEYVLFYKHGRKDPNNQHESYQNRVDLQDKDMKDGNVSLILKNVTKNDTGTYMCWVFQKGKNDLINIINLEVHDDSWKTIIGVVVVIIPLILALGFVVHKKLQNRKRKILFNALQEVIQRLERNNPEINNQLQQEEQENENLEVEQVELDELNSDTNSDPTGSDEKNQQEEGVPLAAGVHE